MLHVCPCAKLHCGSSRGIIHGIGWPSARSSNLVVPWTLQALPASIIPEHSQPCFSVTRLQGSSILHCLCRGRVEPLPNETFLTAAGRQMPGQRHLSAFAVLLHTLKLVAYAMLCLAITSNRSYAQVCTLRFCSTLRCALPVLCNVLCQYLKGTSES